MRLSAKCRYALAATTYMAQQYKNNESITLIRISEHLGVSKIYLEQVFSLLRINKIVTSTKGAQGGYQLSRTPDQIPVYEIFSSVETSLFEKTEDTVKDKAPDIEYALVAQIFDPMQEHLQSPLQQLTLQDLVKKSQLYQNEHAYMYYI